jgi:hypothetical protein
VTTPTPRSCTSRSRVPLATFCLTPYYLANAALGDTQCFHHVPTRVSIRLHGTRRLVSLSHDRPVEVGDLAQERC